jgi:hypothetical protein
LVLSDRENIESHKLERLFNTAIPLCAVLSVASAYVQPTLGRTSLHTLALPRAAITARRNTQYHTPTALVPTLDSYPGPNDPKKSSDSSRLFGKRVHDTPLLSPALLWAKGVDMELSMIQKLSLGINTYDRFAKSDVVINDDLSIFGYHLKHHELTKGILEIENNTSSPFWICRSGSQ